MKIKGKTLNKLNLKTVYKIVLIWCFGIPFVALEWVETL